MARSKQNTNSVFFHFRALYKIARIPKFIGNLLRFLKSADAMVAAHSRRSKRSARPRGLTAEALR